MLALLAVTLLSAANAMAPSEFAAWSQQMSVASGTEAGGGAVIQPGKAVRASLHPAEHFKLVPAPKVIGPNGVTLTVAVSTPGMYRVALGTRAWVDLICDGKVMQSTVDRHGPRCMNIRKMIDFLLFPGTYTLQLSGSEAVSIAVLAARVA